MSKDWNSDILRNAYNGLCGVINVLDYQDQLHDGSNLDAAEKSFAKAFKNLKLADKEYARLQLVLKASRFGEDPLDTEIDQIALPYALLAAGYKHCGVCGNVHNKATCPVCQPDEKDEVPCNICGEPMAPGPMIARMDQASPPVMACKSCWRPGTGERSPFYYITVLAKRIWKLEQKDD